MTSQFISGKHNLDVRKMHNWTALLFKIWLLKEPLYQVGAITAIVSLKIEYKVTNNKVIKVNASIKPEN